VYSGVAYVLFYDLLDLGLYLSFMFSDPWLHDILVHGHSVLLRELSGHLIFQSDLENRAALGVRPRPGDEGILGRYLEVEADCSVGFLDVFMVEPEVLPI